MNRMTAALLGTALAATFAAGAIAQPRPSGPAPMAAHQGMGSMGGLNFDPAQLPEIKGKVAQYTLTPWGDVDGLILDDGTEIQLPPHMSTGLVYAVRPGDSVSIRGLKARATAMVVAASITNTATGATISSQAEHTAQDVTGVVKATLHTPRGDAGGVLLQDGTVVRLPPPEFSKLADILAVGKTITVRGEGTTTPLGHVIAAREIGATPDKLTKVGRPHMEGMMRGSRDHMPKPQ